MTVEAEDQLASWASSAGSERVALFDLDGTLWHMGTPLPGAVEAVRELREAGWRVGVVTNNTFSNGRDVLRRLEAVDMNVDYVSSVLDAAIDAFASRARGRRVVCVGGEAVATAMLANGYELSDKSDADVVVVGNDLDLRHGSLSVALESLLSGALFVALSMDACYVGEGDRMLVGGGAIVEALSYASGRRPDVVVGKPATHLLERAIAAFGAARNQCVYVGDSLASDVAAANACGVASVLVLTGVESRSGDGRTWAGSASSAGAKPTAVLADVAELTRILLNIDRQNSRSSIGGTP